jgi:hypothetical protein
MRVGFLAILLSMSVGLSGCTAGCEASQSASGQEAGCSNAGAFSYAKQMSMSSATETKTWSNSASKAAVQWSMQMSSGSMSVTVKDAAGATVFSKTFSGMGQQASSSTTSAGQAGDWTITIKFVGATGQVAFNMNPV